MWLVRGWDATKAHNTWQQYERRSACEVPRDNHGPPEFPLRLEFPSSLTVDDGVRSRRGRFEESSLETGDRQPQRRSAGELDSIRSELGHGFTNQLALGQQQVANMSDSLNPRDGPENTADFLAINSGVRESDPLETPNRVPGTSPDNSVTTEPDKKKKRLVAIDTARNSAHRVNQTRAMQFKEKVIAALTDADIKVQGQFAASLPSEVKSTTERCTACLAFLGRKLGDENGKQLLKFDAAAPMPEVSNDEEMIVTVATGDGTTKKTLSTRQAKHNH